MTYNVFGGTLNLAQFNSIQSSARRCVATVNACACSAQAAAGSRVSVDRRLSGRVVVVCQFHLSVQRRILSARRSMRCVVAVLLWN